MANLLLNTVKRQKSDLNRYFKLDFKPRRALQLLQKQLQSPLIKVISGPRRCGKSTLALMAVEGTSFCYLNFEDESIPAAATGDDC